MPPLGNPVAACFLKMRQNVRKFILPLHEKAATGGLFARFEP